MLYLVGAYSVVWLLTFLFVVAILRRQQQVERQVEMLEDVLRVAIVPRQAEDELSNPEGNPR